MRSADRLTLHRPLQPSQLPPMHSTAAAHAASAHHEAASSSAAAAAASSSAVPAASSTAAASGATVPSRPMLPYTCRSVTQYQKLELLGEGTYGTVYRARDRSSGDIVALKKIRPMKSSGGGGFPLTSLREISLLQQVAHPSIIRLREIVVGRKVDNIFLVFDYAAHDLASLVDRMSRPFSEREVKQILVQLLQATEYLHANFIIHRDLKLSNLLINTAGELKLADFGLARLFSNPLQDMTPKVVTLWYRSPETNITLLLTCGQNTAGLKRRLCDDAVSRSVGCIFGELLRHRPLLPGKSDLHQLSLICGLLGTPNEKIWPGFTALHSRSGGGSGGDDAPMQLPQMPYNNLSHEFPLLSEAGLDLLSRMLTFDPAKRITADKALNHPYFKQAPLPLDIALMPTFSTKEATAAAATAETATTTAAATNNTAQTNAATADATAGSKRPSDALASAPSTAASAAATATSEHDLKRRKL